MSADNYYTVKLDKVGLEWFVLHGFMSGLDEGIPALLRGGETGYENWGDAAASIMDEYSEYGMIQEPSPLDEILSADQWREHLERTIETAQEHLDWINGKDDDE